MREIKFRGKAHDDGRWLYGSLDYRQWYSQICQKVFISTMTGGGEVRPETVGQFTGLYDKNGKEIYEGDIIEAGNLVGVVEYFNGSFTLGADCPLCMLTVELKVVDNIYNNL